MVRPQTHCDSNISFATCCFHIHQWGSALFWHIISSFFLLEMDYFTALPRAHAAVEGVVE